MRRRDILATLLAAAICRPVGGNAQRSPGNVSRLGFLAVRGRSTPSHPDVYYDAFVQGLHELGYIEGQNLTIDWRFAEGRYERLAELAAELVRIEPQAIVTHSTAATEVLHRETSEIPIVSVAVGDPVRSGFAASLARPGGNITGLFFDIDLSPKHIELLKLGFPRLSRVGVLVSPGNPTIPSHCGALRRQRSSLASRFCR
jgi:putative ABC transport system substrate-binding protein